MDTLDMAQLEARAGISEAPRQRKPARRGKVDAVAAAVFAVSVTVATQVGVIPEAHGEKLPPAVTRPPPKFELEPPPHQRAITRSVTHPVMEQLNTIARYEADWDGDGASAPAAAAVSAARQALAMMLAATSPADAMGPYIAPGTDGEVGIEWRRVGRELHVYCLADGTYEVLLAEGDGEERSGGVDVVIAAIKWFVG